jgi:SAM-dependent methyltransferase
MTDDMSTSPSRPAHFVRSKIERDLGDPDVQDDVRTDQIAYYRTRAPWYDDVYTCTGDYDSGPIRNAEWLDDLAHIEAALAAAPLRGECVELGAGTGYWSERIINQVERIWLLDAVDDVLDIARRKLGERAKRAEFEVVDLWHWEPQRTWDCAVACYFFEHVPDEVLPKLLRALHHALAPGGCVVFAEASSRRFEPQVETRPIGIRTFQVVERRRTEGEFAEAFDDAGFSLQVTRGPRIIHGVALRDPDKTARS